MKSMRSDLRQHHPQKCLYKETYNRQYWWDTVCYIILCPEKLAPCVQFLKGQSNKTLKIVFVYNTNSKPSPAFFLSFQISLFVSVTLFKLYFYLYIQIYIISVSGYWRIIVLRTIVYIFSKLNNCTFSKNP